MDIIVSVIVCTYNREAVLPLCLQSLAEQTLDKGLFEVIVVNNCSTDNTQEVAEFFARNYGNFRVVLEKRQGLSHARNRGWKEAVGKYVAYIDDDALAYSDWISSIVEFIERQPDASIFGGPYDSFALVPKPDWFPSEYGSLSLGEQERCIKVGCEWIIGLNMVIRKDLFYRYGGFDERLGMTGGKTAYGEEINFFLCMHDKGYQIFYVPSIRVKHLIAEYKMNLYWLLLSGYSVGRQYELIFNIRKSLLSHLMTLVKTFAEAICKLFRPTHWPIKRRIYYSFYRLYHEFGALVEHLSSYFIHKL